MDQAKIEAYLSKNGPKLPESKFAELRAALAQINDDQLISLESVKLKSPTTMTLIAWLLGFWAIDRFAMGQILYGVIKLLTCGEAGFGGLLISSQHADVLGSIITLN